MIYYYTYIFKCSDGSYYTGVTNNIERRVSEHNLGLNSKRYTYCRRPVELVYWNEFTDIREAILFEKQIKGWSRAKKEALIAHDISVLKSLSNLKKDKST